MGNIEENKMIEEKKTDDKMDNIGENLILEENKDDEEEIKNNKEEENIFIGKEIEIINYNENLLIKKIIDYYLKTLDTSLTARFNKNIKNNKITLLLGLKLPGMKYFLSCFRIYIKSELCDKYYNNEKEIRFIEQEEDYLKEVEYYKKRIKNNYRNMETEINKNELFQRLIEISKIYPEDSKKFYEWLLDDYYLLFLSDTLQNIKSSFKNMEEYKNILKKMIYLRFNNENEIEDNDPVKSIAMKMVWLESNSQYISILLNIYQTISLKETNLFNKIEKIIENKEIQYEISTRSPYFTEEVNSPFFNIMESLLRIITSDFDMYRNLKGQEFYDFINSLKTIVQNALRIVDELIIFSKEVFTIQEFLNIQDSLNNANKSNIDNLLKILKILFDHSLFANKILKDQT